MGILDPERDRLLGLHRVSMLVGGQSRAADVVREALDSAVRAVDAGVASIYHWDAAQQVLRCIASSGQYEWVAPSRIEFGTSLAGLAFAGQVSIVENEYQHVPNAIPTVRASGLQALMAVPITHAGERLGVLAIGRYDDRHFDRDDTQLLELFAGQVAIALEHAERTAQLERRLERVRTLHRLTRLVSTSLNLDEVLREIARAAVELTGAVFASFWLADDAAQVVRLGPYSDPAFGADSNLREMAYGQGTSGRVAQSRQPMQIDDVFEEGQSMILDWWKAHGLTSMLAVPVLHGDQLLAVLALNGQSPFRLDALDAEMLDTFLAQAGAAIHNASLYAEVHRHREQLQAIVDHSPTAISLKDVQGRLLLTNRRWKLARGFDPDAPPERDVTRGRTDHELFPKEMADVLRDRDVQVIESGENLEYEVPIELGGEPRVYLSVKFPLLDQSGVIYSIGTISTDITERKHWEEGIAASLEAQRVANEQLERLNRAKSDFVSIVSHEFRTPLTGIQGLSELLRDVDFEPAQVRLFAADINQEAQRLGRMINEMLDLDRMEAGEMRLRLEAVDLGTIVREVVDRARPTAPGHLFEVLIDGALPMLTGDRDKLTQVVVNLISNAIKYSPSGGTIVASVGLGRRLIQSEVHFWVRDNGVGIPSDKLDTVFDRYRRIDSEELREVEGTGLGLPIVRQIVELHGGQVWVESEVGRGSTFHAFLPVAGRPLSGAAERVEGGVDDRRQ